MPLLDLTRFGFTPTESLIYEVLLTNGPGTGYALARAAGLGDVIRVRLADREISGRFETLDDAGRLVLIVAEGGREAIAAGDVIALEGSGRSPIPQSGAT